ncbi:hypothetical protein KKC97_13085 [bacterium]|nr:hypothetical protein [bacterium]
MNARGRLGVSIILTASSLMLTAAAIAQDNTDTRNSYPPKENQSPRILWNRYYGGAQDDAAYSVCEIDDGQLAVGGDCVTDSTGLRRMCLTLLNNYGDVEWMKAFEGDQTASCRAVKPTNEGGFVMCGSTRGVGSRGIDHYVVKTDAEGLEEWSRISQERGADYAEDILHARGGGFISVGRKISDAVGDSTGAFHIVKTNKPGKIVWTRNYNGEQANAVIEVEEGNLVAVGYTKVIPQSARPPKPPKPTKMPWESEEEDPDTSLCLDEAAFYMVRVNWKGETIRTNTYWNSGWDIAYDVKQTKDGGFLIAGAVGGCKDRPEGYDCWVIRTDNKGDTLWTNRFGGEREDQARGIIETDDGGIIVTGYTYSYGEGRSDMLVYKLSAKGELLWSKTIGGAKDEFAHDIRQTTDGGYIIAGSTESYGAGGWDMYLVKLTRE